MILFIDEDQTALAKLDTDLLQPQTLHIALPARGDQGDVELLFAAGFEGHIRPQVPAKARAEAGRNIKRSRNESKKQQKS